MGRRCDRAFSLPEAILGIVIVVLASLGTLTYFAYGLGNIHRQGDRRIGLEYARKRMEELLAVNADQLKPADSQHYWIACISPGGGVPCVWTRAPATAPPPWLNGNDQGNDSIDVQVGDLVGELPILASIQRLHDPAAGTDPSTLDIMVLDVRVWFSPNPDRANQVTTQDDDFHRVYLRTLRTS